MRPRVGLLSPLPPADSGIADYAAELLPALAEHVDLELVVPPGGPAPAADRVGGLPLHPWRDLARVAARTDVLLYHLGNNHRFHGALYRALPEHPGVVVLHEVVLHHMVRELTLVAGDAAGYVEEMRYAYGRAGAARARRSIATGVPLDPFAYPLFERAADAATALIVHSETTRRRVLASRPGARVRAVPHHVALGAAAAEEPAAARRAARARLGLAADDFLVGTFGYQTPPKRLGVVVAAFRRLRRTRPGARLAVVGNVERRVAEAAFAGADGAAGVLRVGHVADLDRFLDWMRAVDVAVNLRHPTGGETSGTVIRLLGLGRPLVVSDTGAFAEIPAGCAARVPVGAGEEEVLAAYLEALAADPGLRRELGENARRHMARHHTLTGSAGAYVEVLAEAAAAGRPGPYRPVPPLAPWDADDLATEVLAGVAADAADLGVGEDDDELLAALAGPWVELGLDGGARGSG